MWTGHYVSQEQPVYTVRGQFGVRLIPTCSHNDD